MRCLTPLSPLDDRVDRAASRDRGVAAIVVVIAMTAILLGAALAIDVGRYVLGARSAQNSADATALAVATDCALDGAPIADYSPYRKMEQTITSPYCGDGRAPITVTAAIDHTFLLQSAGDVDRSATARWGTLGGAITLPIVIANCEFSPDLLDGAPVTLYLDDPKPQTGCSSLPGGFSQLDRIGQTCAVEITAGSLATGKPGADLHKAVPCITNPSGPALPVDVLVPMYDAAACAASGCKGKGPYMITGFAHLRLEGYSFNGNAYDGTLGKKCPEEKDRGKYCISGTFERFTTSQGTPGPSTDYGLYQVWLAE
jgi:Flp pilus assembly protein TadG